jgi:type I restriction system adenine methylase HsdM
MSERGWPGADSWRDGAQRIAPTIVGGSRKSGGPDLGPAGARQAWKALGVNGLGIANEAPGPDFPIHQEPKLTARMVARIQGFPDSWIFSGRKTAAYRQVSNAFPPPEAKALGQAIREALIEKIRVPPASGLRRRASRAADRPASTHTLSLSELEKHLWAAADMLRGQMDASESNQIVSGLLFLKHASDTFDWHREHLIGKPATSRAREAAERRAEQPELYSETFFVPTISRWQYLRALSHNIGDGLNRALAALEDANPSLSGSLRHIDFVRRVGSLQTSDRTLRELIAHFSIYRMCAEDFESPDVLGAAYESLFKKFVSSPGRRRAEFYTPRALVRLMVQLVKPTDGTSVYDPCSGSGGMLIAAKQYVEEHGDGSGELHLAGQEINSGIWSMSKMNMLLRGMLSADLRNGDSLAEPMHVQGGQLELFDRILSDPPSSWNYSRTHTAYPDRFRWGWAPERGKRAGLMFAQHMVAVLKPDRGVAAMVMPQGVLFRGGAERDIRTRMLDDDLIEAVIKLPPKLVAGSGIPLAVLVLRPRGSKPSDRVGKVLFINAASEFSPGRVSNDLTPKNIQKIVAAYEALGDIPGYSRVIDREKILGKGDNLTVEQYTSDVPEPQLHVASANEWESQARALVRAGRYEEAMPLLKKATLTDTARAERLNLEFGFIGMPDVDRQIVAGVWSPVAIDNNFPLPLTETATVPAVATSPVPVAATAEERSAGARMGDRRPLLSPQRSGVALEQATIDLFTRLFSIEADARELLIYRLRRQAAGNQFGHDIELDCSVAGNPAVHCHVECKNLDRSIDLNDIAAKLTQQKFYHRDAQVDHWILISPHGDPSNEVRSMLNTWEETAEYPFSVQIWSPENGIRELFALEPEVYRKIYGRLPTDGEMTAAARSARMMQDSLAPYLRIDEVWRRYLADPLALCFVNEDVRHFAELFANHLPLKAANERGAVLEGTLIDQVDAWIDSGDPAPFLLLADFGEGKSVFTYCLARRLCEAFRRAPAEHPFPLRIPLREFRQVGSGRALLGQRLAEIGATVADWRRLADQMPTLAILDGFDEMSPGLSPRAVTENLRGIESCIAELSSSKILITSRQRVLDGTRDWQRTLNRLQRPKIVYIASGARSQRVRYLEQFATDKNSSRVLENLRNLYDPIGLAAKPLFLQMIRETLTELPSDSFSELVLYDTYITKSLRRKIEFLEDEELTLTSEELISNLLEVLEDIAVQLQQANEPYVYLRDQKACGTRMAELLWKMRDEAAPRPSFDISAEDDATARVGIRSLLKAVPALDTDRWPVDFFHRSMREYFVARAIVRCLRVDENRARHILSAVPLLPEITHFAAQMLDKETTSTSLSRLESFARSATTELDAAYLGGNAISLYYASRGEVPSCDWSGLRLDHAQLQGADLRGARFVATSLRYANLDNANLENANLIDADLEGVQLDETSQVLAVATLGSDRIFAAYEDRSVREWRLRHGTNWESQVVVRLEHKAERLYQTPNGYLVASGDSTLSVLDIGGGGPKLRSQFGMKSRFRSTIFGAASALFAEEVGGGVTRVVWFDLPMRRAHDSYDVDAVVTCCAQLDGRLYAIATEKVVHVISSSRDGKRCESKFNDRGVSCLDLKADHDGVVVATGHYDGTVNTTRIATIGQNDTIERLWQHRLHSGTVTSILFGDSGQMITGSTDRTICVMSAANMQFSAFGPQIHRLHLTLSCRNVQFAGVRTKREREKLRKYSSI